MLISDAMAAKLNKQINSEQYSAHLYLGMAGTSEAMGLRVFAQYFVQKAAEETEHAMKLYKYVVDTGAKIELGAIAEPTRMNESVPEIANAALEHEIIVTNQIKDLAALAEEEKDYLTRSFLNWFLDEQVEEVASAQELVDMVRLTPSGMLMALESRVARLLSNS